jgi:hypothetical protein
MIEIYNYLKSKKIPRVTVRILLGHTLDGVDRMTIMLGKGSSYDYKLLRDPSFRDYELKKIQTEYYQKMNKKSK